MNLIQFNSSSLIIKYNHNYVPKPILCTDVTHHRKKVTKTYEEWYGKALWLKDTKGQT